MHVLATRLSEVAGRDPKATKSHRISCSKEADRLSIICSIMLTLRQPTQLRPAMHVTTKPSLHATNTKQRSSWEFMYNLPQLHTVA